MSNEQVRWLLKVIQPERTLASLPGGASLGQEAHAALLGLPVEIYAAELGRMQEEASEAAGALLADQAVASMVDRLPLRKGAKVVVFGDSLTSDPQSWAVILREMLAMRRGTDGISLTISAVAGETTTHGLVRAGQISPIPSPTGSSSSSARMTHARRARTPPRRSSITRRPRATLPSCVSAFPERPRRSCVWITPPAVNEEQVAAHWGLARFGVRFRNEDLERVAEIVRDGDGPVIDAFSSLGSPPPSDLLMERRSAFHSGGPEANGTRGDPWLEQAHVKYLVIGATGNIGSRVAQRLVDSGARPSVFVRSAKRARALFGDHVDIHTGDLEKPGRLARCRAGWGRRDIPRDGWIGSREARSRGLLRCPRRRRTTRGQALYAGRANRDRHRSVARTRRGCRSGKRGGVHVHSGSRIHVQRARLVGIHPPRGRAALVYGWGQDRIHPSRRHRRRRHGRPDHARPRRPGTGDHRP